MFKDLVGKRVFVTGSSRGIGAAVAEGFASAGAHVALHANTSVALGEERRARIEASGGRASLLVGDVRDPTRVREMVEEAAERLGGLDILVNNAGHLLERRRLEAVDAAFVDEMLALNVRSVVLATQAAVRHLDAAGGGVVINTSSLAARVGGGGGSFIYAAAKAGISTITRGLAKELAPRGIRVNAVAPGLVRTDLLIQTTDSDALLSWSQAIPLGRMAEPEDCVGAYLFLASEGCSGYITGQVIEVNGGLLMP